MIKKMMAVCTLFSLVILGIGAASLYAEENVEVRIRIIKASNTASAFDSSLSDIKSQLSRLNYSSYRLITVASKSAPVRNHLEFSMPNGDSMRVVLLDIENTFIKLLVSMDKAGLKTNFKIVNNGTVIMGGDQYEDGYLVVAITASY